MFLELKSVEVAEQLTLIDFNMFKSIRVRFLPISDGSLLRFGLYTEVTDEAWRIIIISHKNC
jgi:hypothetical protein